MEAWRRHGFRINAGNTSTYVNLFTEALGCPELSPRDDFVITAGEVGFSLGTYDWFKREITVTGGRNFEIANLATGMFRILIV